VRILLLASTAIVLFAANSFAAEEKPKPNVVVNFSKLIPFLPAAPEGWTAEKPDGSTIDTPELKISTAGCSYAKGDADDAPTASINITDASGSRDYATATTAAWNVTSETAAGFDKPVAIDGNRGFEHYEKEGQTSTLWVIAGGRFFVQIELTHLDPTELQVWLKKIDLKKLAALK
jgi:hypothetical protein